MLNCLAAVASSELSVSHNYYISLLLVEMASFLRLTESENPRFVRIMYKHDQILIYDCWDCRFWQNHHCCVFPPTIPKTTVTLDTKRTACVLLCPRTWSKMICCFRLLRQAFVIEYSKLYLLSQNQISWRFSVVRGQDSFGALLNIRTECSDFEMV